MNLSTEFERVQSGVRESARKVWLAGLGAVSTLEEESAGFFDELVERGKSLESESRRRFRKIRTRMEDRAEDLGDRLDSQVAEVLQRMGIPSRRQVQGLTRRVETLMEQVDRLAEASSPAAAPKRSKSAAKRSTSAKKAG